MDDLRARVETAVADGLHGSPEPSTWAITEEVMNEVRAALAPVALAWGNRMAGDIDETEFLSQIAEALEAAGIELVKADVPAND